MRIVFMGTPDIAAASLAELLSQGHRVAGVFTREDKPVGRKQVLTPPPVKVLAHQNNIPVYQPKSLRTAEALQVLKKWEPQVVVVVAYGRILPAEMLAVPVFGCVNLHVSMLPKYRGAAPIQWAVINGEAKTGISIMKLDEGMDTGPVLAQQAVEIGPEQTAGEVFEMMSRIGARLLCATVGELEAGSVTPQPQQGEPSYAPPLAKRDALLDFGRSAEELHNLVRGCNPWPLAWFEHEGKRVKVLRTKVLEEGGKPGEVLQVNPLTVACGSGALVLELVVPQGARAMKGSEWAAGRRFKAGEVLEIALPEGPGEKER